MSRMNRFRDTLTLKLSIALAKCAAVLFQWSASLAANAWVTVTITVHPDGDIHENIEHERRPRFETVERTPSLRVRSPHVRTH